MFDKDGGGTVSTKELKQVFEALGQHPSEEDVRAMISEVDKDGMYGFVQHKTVLVIETVQRLFRSGQGSTCKHVADQLLKKRKRKEKLTFLF